MHHTISYFIRITYFSIKMQTQRNCIGFNSQSNCSLHRSFTNNLGIVQDREKKNASHKKITAPRTPNEGFVEFVLFECVCNVLECPLFLQFFSLTILLHIRQPIISFITSDFLEVFYILKFLLLLSHTYNLHFFNVYFLVCFVNKFIVFNKFFWRESLKIFCLFLHT